MTPAFGLFCALALTLALVFYVFRPELAAAQSPAPTADEASRRARLAQLDENRRDLDFEYRAGKYSDEDYQKQRQELDAAAARLMSPPAR